MNVTTYNFDQEIDRTNTSCLKYDFKSRYNKPEDVLPMWVADMDFSVPQEIIDAIKVRADHGIYGYTIANGEYNESVIGWMKRRHGYDVDAKWILQLPGIVFALATAVKAYTEVGESVMIQTPVYYPFYDVIRNNDRKIVTNSLVYRKDEVPAYHMDYEALEADIVANDVKLFVLCSPHNPVGRVWTTEELYRLGEILKRHNVLMISDEIHMDFVYSGKKHEVFANVDPSFEAFTVTCTAPSKTFNLAGIQSSNLIISDETLRGKFQKEMAKTGYCEPNVFALVACQAAYEHGGEYVDALNEYLEGNVTFIREYLEEHLPKIKLVEPEGTYLLWLDFSEYGLTATELSKVLLDDAKVWFNPGEIFGKEGAGFQRINIATNRSVIEVAMESMKEAFGKLVV